VLEFALLMCAGFIAGAMNALVGGGSFVTLPALVTAGLSSVSANASSSVALYPGGAVSAFVYRAGPALVCGVPVRALMLPSIVGGCGGALLLLWTPTAVFDRVLPWLLLVATIALAWGPQLVRLHGSGVGHRRLVAVIAQFLLGTYAGYFGGAVGILMMAAWRMLGEHDVKSLNGPRILLVTTANTAGLALFIAAGIVRWTAVLPVCAGALAGGYLGAHIGKRLPTVVVRLATIVVSASITVAFFVRAYRVG
jgi:uncharacterized protein